MQRQKLVHAVKHTGYALAMLLLYVLQVTPRFFSLFGVKPMLIVPLAICIAMVEGEFVGGLYGVLCGLLLDFGAFTLFGINSIIMLVSCVAAGLLVIYLMRPGLRSAIILTFATAVTICLAHYFFLYGMWGLKDASLIFYNHSVPMILYTTICAIPINMGVHVYYKKFQERLEP